MTYPDHHPKAEEIKAKKADIDVLYVRMKQHEEDSRRNYKEAMESLRAMGEAHRAIHEILHEIAGELGSLKGIIDGPSI